jgi:hypothetical protein
MKKLVVILSFCAVVGGVLVSGCSKSKNTSTQPGNSADAPAASTMTGGPAEMRIKWTAGKKYAMRMEFEQGTETKLPSQPQPMKVEVKLAQDFDFSVLKELDNGGKELELEFENETMDVLQGGRSVMSFDSTQRPAQDTNNPVAPIMRAMIGARIQYFTDADGKVEKVDGVDKLMSRIAAGAKPQQQAMFKQMFSKDTLKQYGSFADMMPNRMVNVGESWSVKRDIVSGVGNLTVDMKYTFKNWEQHGDRKCAHIEAAGDISSKGVSTATGAAVEIEQGKISGDVWFDPDLGMIVDIVNDQNMTLKITTRAQTMTPQLNQKIRVTLVDVQ